MEELKRLSVKSQEKKSGGSQMDDLLQFNQLVYSLPMVNSLVTRRNLQTYTFDSTSYNQDSGQMSCTLNTGEQYVNFANSWLQFDLSVTSNDNRNWDFGSGSAVNLFSETTWTSRQGTVLSRNAQNNVFQIQEHKLKKSPDWYNSQGQLMGYFDIDAQGYTGYAHTAPVSIVIPLRYINTMCDSQMLCPDTICSGARLTLTLERIKNAIRFIGGATTVHAFTISNAKLVVDAHTLTESAFKSLKLQGTRGLEYICKGLHHESSPITTNFNTTISKSVARALEVIAVPLLDANINSDTADSLITPDLVYDEFQVQLGSLVLPQQKLIGNVPIYTNVLYGADQLSDIDDRGSFLKFSDFTTHYGALRQNLQTQSLLDFSGQSCNNSRNCKVLGSMSTGGAKTFHVFLTYMSVIRAFNTSIAVSS